MMKNENLEKRIDPSEPSDGCQLVVPTVLTDELYLGTGRIPAVLAKQRNALRRRLVLCERVVRQFCGRNRYRLHLLLPVGSGVQLPQDLVGRSQIAQIRVRPVVGEFQGCEAILNSHTRSMVRIVRLWRRR